MKPFVGRLETEAFRDAIAQHLGLAFEDGKLDFLADILRARLESTGGTRCDAYFGLLGSTDGRRELRVLAEQLTVGETFFLRNADQFSALVEVALRERMRSRGMDRRLRILSAGCASGEEPYSIAMVIRDRLPELEAWSVQITGVDVNAASLGRAAQAKYSPWALRATPDDVRGRYFDGDGRDLVLKPVVRRMVTFEERNLVSDDQVFRDGLACDVIFCRNVLMYFAPAALATVVRRLTKALLPGGYLFLGHAETLRGISQDFHLCHTHETFYYRRKAAGDSETETVPSPPSQPPSAGFDPLPAMVDAAASWVDVIRRASERITSLTDGPAAANGVSQDTASTGHARELAQVRELMQQERFGDALALLRAMPPAALNDPDALLLRAILLANGGRLDESEEICRRLLALDELNAGAHYVMALCREHAADEGAAVEHDQTAVYLDSGFAMPHLHLGLLARRRGDPTTARRELGLAQVLLVREDAPRILLFGGGFSREMLMKLCRSELRAVGEAT